MNDYNKTDVKSRLEIQKGGTMTNHSELERSNAGDVGYRDGGEDFVS